MKTLLISLLILTATAAKAEFNSAHLNLSKISDNMIAINPLLKTATNAQISYDAKVIELTIHRSMPPCGPGMMCIQVMPAPLTINLSVVQVVKTPCSVKYIAATPANIKTPVYEEVIFEDFSKSVCEINMKNLGSVTYKATGVSNATKLPDTATASFTVEGDFSRESNQY